MKDGHGHGKWEFEIRHSEWTGWYFGSLSSPRLHCRIPLMFFLLLQPALLAATYRYLYLICWINLESELVDNSAIVEITFHLGHHNSDMML